MTEHQPSTDPVDAPVEAPTDVAAEDLTAEMMAVAVAWAEAIVADDADGIASFMTDDWVIVSETGVSPRAEFLSAVSSGALSHSTMELVSTPRVRRYSDTTIVTGRVTNTAHVHGTRFDADEWTTDVFVRRGGRWQCALTHITTVAGSESELGG